MELSDYKSTMLEDVITHLLSLPAWGVLLTAFVFAFIENIFPPSPSDVVLVFCGTLVGLESVGFIELVAVATLGSGAGFLTAFFIGRRYGPALVSSRWLPFITPGIMSRINLLFERWHQWLIVVNRFLAGTRAVVAFAAGTTKMPVGRTTGFAMISALLWNAIMVAGGGYLGANWRLAEEILSVYGWAIVALIVLLILFVFVRRRLRKEKQTNNS